MLCQSLLYSKMTQLDTYIHCFFMFFSIMIYHRLLNIVPCVTRQDFSCLSILNVTVRIYQPQTPSPSLSLPARQPQVCLLRLSLFLFYRQVHLCHVLNSTCKGYHTVFVFPFLTDVTQCGSFWLYPCFCRWRYLVRYFVCVYRICCVHSSVDGHLACSHVLAIVESAAMNIGAHVSF